MKDFKWEKSKKEAEKKQRRKARIERRMRKNKIISAGVLDVLYSAYSNNDDDEQQTAFSYLLCKLGIVPYTVLLPNFIMHMMSKCIK